jgi:hypothetical protein
MAEIYEYALKTLPLIFNEYKRKSTLYRIASLLGWIRAIHLELSALPRGTSGFLTPVSEAMRRRPRAARCWFDPFRQLQFWRWKKGRKGVATRPR